MLQFKKRYCIAADSFKNFVYSDYTSMYYFLPVDLFWLIPNDAIKSFKWYKLHTNQLLFLSYFFAVADMMSGINIDFTLLLYYYVLIIAFGWYVLHVWHNESNIGRSV